MQIEPTDAPSPCDPPTQRSSGLLSLFDRHAALAGSLFLLLAVCAVFAQTLTFDFVNFDDTTYVYENPMVQRGLTAESIRWALGANLTFSWSRSGFWAPVTLLSHMLAIEMSGLRPWAHHALNVVCHCGAAVFLYLALLAMGAAPRRSLFAAALFALHPLRVESVAWVAERKDVLCGLFWGLLLLAYAFYCRRRSLGRYFAVLVCFCLGLASKTAMALAPLAMLVLDVWPLQRLRSRGGLGSILIEKAPLVLLAIVAGLVFAQAQFGVGAVKSIADAPLWVRLINAIHAWGAYLADTIWPSGLSIQYPHPGRAICWPQVAVSALAIVALWHTAWRFRFSHPWLLFGLVWFFTISLPTIGLVQTGAYARADRYTYFPHIGLAVAAAWELAEAARRHPSARSAVQIAAAALVLGLGLAAAHQTRYWRNSATLFTRAVEVTEANYVALTNLSEALMRQGRVGEAVRQLEQAARLRPHEAQIFSSLAAALTVQGRFDDALQCARRAARLAPKSPDTLGMYGAALAQAGWPAQAQEVLEKATGLAPDHRHAWANLGFAHECQGHAHRARQAYARALELSKGVGDQALTQQLIGRLQELQGRSDRPLP